MTNMEKVKDIFANADFVKAIEEMETIEELREAIAAQGVELTVEEVQEIAEECAKLVPQEEDEIDEEQMEQISGGFDPMGMALLGFTIGQVAGLLKKQLNKGAKKNNKKSKKR